MGTGNDGILEDRGMVRRRAADACRDDRCDAGASAIARTSIAGRRRRAAVAAGGAFASRTASGRPRRRQAGARPSAERLRPMPPLPQARALKRELVRCAAISPARAAPAPRPTRRCARRRNRSRWSPPTASPIRARSPCRRSLRYVPGVFADAYGPDSRGDYPRIRGQDPNIYLDGTRMVNTFTVQRMAARSLHAGAHRGAARPVIGALWRYLDGRAAEPDLEAPAGRSLRTKSACSMAASTASRCRSTRPAS